MINFIFVIMSYRGSFLAKVFNFIKKKMPGEKHPYHLVFLIGGTRYYTYDHFESISVNRRNQIDALIKEEVLCNMTREESVRVTSTCHEYADSAHALLKAKLLQAGKIINKADAHPQELRHALMQVCDMTEVMMLMKNVSKIQEQVSKRFEMLTLPNIYAKVAALCVFTHGEDTKEMLSPQEVEDRAELFTKKKVLLPMLRLPIRNLFYQLNESKLDSLQYLKMMILQHDQIARAQNLGSLGKPLEKEKI